MTSASLQYFSIVIILGGGDSLVNTLYVRIKDVTLTRDSCWDYSG